MRTVIYAACLFLLLASCRYREVKEQMPIVNEVKTGEKFRITLPESHKNKESWSMLDDYDRKLVGRLNDVWHGESKGLDVNLFCRAPGTTQLTFIKRRFADTVEVRKYLIHGVKAE